ncbi:hypothetical protein HJC23_004504 [Cyclotella cryptica]|uniref:Uncharacterized protein n=1 Tax=Cyclotella cryptica TaxID=29204 RepID=A0ABD3PTF0_9STRA
MSSKYQQKAWNKAMKNVGAVLPVLGRNGLLLILCPCRHRRCALLAEKRRYLVAIHFDMLEGAVEDSTNLRPRSLPSILIEEASRSNSIAKHYGNAAVKSLTVESGNPGGAESNSSVTTKRVQTITRPYPPQKFCLVTGLFEEYTNPKSSIPYASLSALEQV